MVSFSKSHKARLYIFSAAFLIIFSLALVYIQSRAVIGKEQSLKNAHVEKLIRAADSSSDSAPWLAEIDARKALALSGSLGRADYNIRAWLILGKVQNINGDPAKALGFYYRAQAMARQYQLPEALGKATLKIGEITYKRGDYKKALLCFQYVDSVASKNQLADLESYALYYIGKYNQTTGNFKKSSDYYHRAIGIARKLGDKKLLALILPSLGKYYLSDGKLQVALECYLEAFYISEKLNDQLLNADICNHLGGLYLQMNQYNKALTYHKKALAYRHGMNNTEGLAKSYNNIGKAYFELKQYDSSMMYFKKSFDLCERVDYKKGSIKARINMGNLYATQGQPAKAYRLLKESYAQSGKAGYDLGIAESAFLIGDLYKKENAIDTAIYYYQTSLGILQKTNYDELLRNIYLGLFECYNAKGNYKQALGYHTALLEKEKALLNVENNRQLALLSIAFDSQSKEKDNQVLRKDNELKASLIKRNAIFIWLMVVLLGFTTIVCFSIYNRFYLKKKANRQLEELNARITRQNKTLEDLNKELETANQEKDKLFSIIGHELRNPLYWFQNLAEVLSKKYQEMTPEKIKKTVLALDESAKNAFHLMDNLLHWSRSKLNRIHPKKGPHDLHAIVADSMRMYETILAYKEISFRHHIPENIRIFADADLLSCVIRNLISNAIKYTPNQGKVSISCYQARDFVTIVVADSGSGIPLNQMNSIFSDERTLSMPGIMQEKGSGLGLKLCKDFVKLNGGSIWVESIAGFGTQFFFTVETYQVSPSKKIKNALTA